MRLTFEETGNVLIVTLEEPRLDATIAPEFKDAVREVAAAGAEIYLLDMKHVVFMDSSGMGSVIGIMKHLGRSRRLELCNLSPAVLKVFRLTKMDAVLRLHPGREGALMLHNASTARTAG